MKKISILVTLILLITISSCKKATNSEKIEGTWLETSTTENGVAVDHQSTYTNSENYESFLIFTNVEDNKGSVYAESSKIDFLTSPFTVLDVLEEDLPLSAFELTESGDSMTVTVDTSAFGVNITTLTESKLAFRSVEVIGGVTTVSVTEYTKQ